MLKRKICNLMRLTFLVFMVLFLIRMETALAKPIDIAQRVEGEITKDTPVLEYEFITDSVNTWTYVVNVDFQCGDEGFPKDADFLVQVCDTNGNVMKEGSDWIDDTDGWPWEPGSLFVDNCVKSNKYVIKVSAATENIKDTKIFLTVYKSNAMGTAVLSQPSAVYTGKKIKLPKITLYDKAGKKIARSEYKYWIDEEWGSYTPDKPLRKNVKNIGEYYYYVKFGKEFYDDDSFDGTSHLILATFKVTPEKAKITGVTSESGQITVTCKKSPNAKWYAFFLATDKKFKHQVGCRVWCPSEQYTFKNLKRGKTYYVKAAIDGNDYVRGQFSKVVKIRCK